MRGVLLWGCALMACGGQVGGPSAEGGTGDSGTSPSSDASTSIDAGPITSSCKAAGGVLCTSQHWIVCPAGFEPVLPFGDYGCGSGSDKGLCCQQAPKLPCNSGQNNCLDTCSHACWASVPNGTCESGRVCCNYICD